LQVTICLHYFVIFGIYGISLAGAASGHCPKTNESSACMLSRLFKVYFYYYFASPSMHSKWCRYFKFSEQKFVCIAYLSHVLYMLHPSNPSWCDKPKNFWQRYKLWSFWLWDFLHHVSIYTLLRSNMPRSTLV